MATTRKQRLDVGKAIYERRITKYEAARQNHVTESCVTNWLKLYLSKAGIPYTKDVLEISAGGTARDNGAMEAINGWAKEELFCDSDIRDCDDVPSLIEEYVAFFNEERPAAAPGYLTPAEFKRKNGCH